MEVGGQLIQGSTYNDDDHAKCILMSSEDSREDQNDDGHWNSSKSQGKLDVRLPCHDDHELNRKSKEEEEIEFQEGDVDLVLESQRP